MGLDTTHDCWHGSYRNFHQWRKAVCAAAGWGDLDEYVGFRGTGQLLLPQDDVLSVLLDHSDCEGDIPAELCGPLADRLEELLPELSATEPEWVSHRARAETFIMGLRTAAAEGEAVEFQ